MNVFNNRVESAKNYSEKTQILHEFDDIFMRNITGSFRELVKKLINMPPISPDIIKRYRDWYYTFQWNMHKFFIESPPTTTSTIIRNDEIQSFVNYWNITMIGLFINKVVEISNSYKFG